MNDQVIKRINKYKNEWRSEWMNEWMSERTNERVNGLKDERSLYYGWREGRSHDHRADNGRSGVTLLWQMSVVQCSSDLRQLPVLDRSLEELQQCSRETDTEWDRKTSGGDLAPSLGGTGKLFRGPRFLNDVFLRKKCPFSRNKISDGLFFSFFVSHSFSDFTLFTVIKCPIYTTLSSQEKPLFQ